MRSTMLSAIPAACCCLALTAAAPAGGSVEPLTTTLVANGLLRPIFVTHAPGDYKRLFIVQKQGIIRILDLQTGTLNPTAFLNIDSIVGGGTSTGDERGLLGLAFHPDYQANGRFFVDYTNNSGHTVIAEYTRNTPDVANPAGDIIMTFTQPFTNHNGGWLGFSPNDGYLYISTGDGGSGNDPGNRAQDTTDQKLGKLLRLDVNDDDFPGDTNADYAIPADNPFVGITGDDEIWAYGLRNPWRCAFDRANGDLYIADVGQFAWEEINYQRGVAPGGTNYGWRCLEGLHCTGNGGCNCADSSITGPIHEYGHALGCSITGGVVYRGCDIPSLDGTYFFADYCSTRIWSFRFNSMVTEFAERTTELDPAGAVSIQNITGFGEDARGEVYVIDQSGGEIFKIVPVTPTVSPFDFNCDGVVNVDDLVATISAWGACDGCAADVVKPYGEVGVDELVGVITNWSD